MTEESSELGSIYDYIVKLNSADFLPKYAYRRDSISYEIVSLVNNLSCCYIAGNYKVSSIFVERIKNYLDEKVIDSSNYRDLVLAFVYELEKKMEKGGGD